MESHPLIEPRRTVALTGDSDQRQRHRSEMKLSDTKLGGGESSLLSPENRRKPATFSGRYANEQTGEPLASRGDRFVST